MLSLHSTMFLLIRDSKADYEKAKNVFTFHNVSINTTSKATTADEYATLHSTMFLLILSELHL